MDLTCWRRSEDWLGEMKGLVEGDEGIGGRKMGGEKLGVLFLEGEYGGTWVGDCVALPGWVWVGGGRIWGEV